MVKYVNLGYEPKSDDLIAMYYVEIAPECKDLEQACEEIAKESSIGTWTEIATLSPDIAE
ncbi:MAG: ribulose-bisphosphate carboxylase large subunit, partial [Promethearchaeota archaeon]